MFYCYGEQIVQDNTSSAAYNFYELDKELVIMIARAQKGFKIKYFFLSDKLTGVYCNLELCAGNYDDDEVIHLNVSVECASSFETMY
jgi:hypothetical protein